MTACRKIFCRFHRFKFLLWPLQVGLGYLHRPLDPDRVQLDLNQGLDRSRHILLEGFVCLGISRQEETLCYCLCEIRFKLGLCHRVVRKGEAAEGGAEGLTNMLQCILHYRYIISIWSLFLRLWDLKLFLLPQAALRPCFWGAGQPSHRSGIKSFLSEEQSHVEGVLPRPADDPFVHTLWGKGGLGGHCSKVAGNDLPEAAGLMSVYGVRSINDMLFDGAGDGREKKTERARDWTPEDDGFLGVIVMSHLFSIPLHAIKPHKKCILVLFRVAQSAVAQ